jgi:hypothetical protein
MLSMAFWKILDIDVLLLLLPLLVGGCVVNVSFPSAFTLDEVRSDTDTNPANIIVTNRVHSNNKPLFLVNIVN